MNTENNQYPLFRLGLTLSVLLLLNACSTITYSPQEPVVVSQPASRSEIPRIEKVPLPTVKPEVPSVPSAPKSLPKTQRSTAVIALLDTAENHQQQGDYRSAQTTLQRAQRIAPQDPEVYYKLAATHRELEDFSLAEQVARKGISIVQGQPNQLKRFWLLLSEIYSLAGNDDAANTAQQKANSYSY